MEFCLSNHCGSRYLVKADQIRVAFRDRASIPDTYHKFKKPIILFPSLEGEEYDWKQLVTFSTICNNNFYVICPSIGEINIAKEYGLKYFMAEEATSAWDLRAMIELGCSYAYVGAPLFFDLGSVRELPIKLRAIPTVSYNHHLPHKSGVYGQWIRPEDLDKYDGLLDTIEFEFCHAEREQTLFKVYAKDHQWPTRLDILVTDLDSHAINRVIVPELAKRRLICRQECQAEGRCYMCATALHLAEEDMIEKMHEVAKKEKK